MLDRCINISILDDRYTCYVQSRASVLQASSRPRKQSTEMPAGPSWMYFPNSWQKGYEVLTHPICQYYSKNMIDVNWIEWESDGKIMRKSITGVSVSAVEGLDLGKLATKSAQDCSESSMCTSKC